jgi:hypothetical protein
MLFRLGGPATEPDSDEGRRGGDGRFDTDAEPIRHACRGIAADERQPLVSDDKFDLGLRVVAQRRKQRFRGAGERREAEDGMAELGRERPRRNYPARVALYQPRRLQPTKHIERGRARAAETNHQRGRVLGGLGRDDRENPPDERGAVGVFRHGAATSAAADLL